MADDLEDDGFDVEHFISILAETAKSAATCRAHTIATRRQMHDFFTGQMRWQRSIWRLAFADERYQERRQFGFRRLQFLQRKFELADLASQVLRKGRSLADELCLGRLWSQAIRHAIGCGAGDGPGWV
jgi:hypothetical protein